MDQSFPAGDPSRLDAELLQQLLRSDLHDAIAFKDARRRYVRLNEAACRMLGIASPAEIIGQTSDRFLSAKRARMCRQEDTRVLVTGETLTDRIETVTHDDGTVKWYSATKAPLKDATGAVTGLVEIARDITVERLERQLQDQFVATMSHELRTPVSAIMGSLSLILSGAAGALPESVRRMLKIASTNSQRLLRLVNDILDMEKLTSGMMAFELQPVDVHAIVEQEMVAMQAYAESFGVRLRLKDGAPHAAVRADPTRLAQVINNLLSNAVKFSPHGAEVLISIDDTPRSVRISVRDHGPGIPPEYRERIFEKFVQTARTQKAGSGLGLSIVKQIVARLHGEVGFEPAPGGGTIFYVTLPSWEKETADSAAPYRSAGGKE